ncbi:Acg family FMN-binding oxidoreductase [Streptomyces benahoarensis]|uniref:Nitroreductase n=1 Tax=Streptomyces benahoarensis TaxID=2595054 RepID=A0A553ZNY5_9ACTN|nr:nitroreductase [Streptomyces benahoarensis]TSB31321.1 nitroreductase [Streptomyces benahoarensis]TSB43006.1 nitroreductase [Streptomyces benahoarensis]
MSAPTLDDTLVRALVADAVTAPSQHNAQPWRFRYARADHTLTLDADPDRALPQADPTGRGLHLGCGAALLNLRVSAAHAGLHAAPALLPDPRRPAALAAVRLDASGEPVDPDLVGLHEAIHARHTSRLPYTDREIPPPVRTALLAAAAVEGACLTFLTGPHRETVLDLITQAEGYNRLDEARDAEQRRWTHETTAASPADDGIPDYAFGPRSPDATAPVRDFAGRRAQPGRAYATFERRPQLATLSTPGDAPADWLRGGQALQRVLLRATRQGLVSSFATQPVEWPDLRWILRDPVSGAGHVQMILRLGYGPEGPATPRRPVDQVLTITP